MPPTMNRTAPWRLPAVSPRARLVLAWRAPAAVAVFLLVAAALNGCAPPTMPTQQNPSCSWEKAVPAGADRICRITFRTIKALVDAEAQGRDRTVYQLVTNRRVAKRIAAHGAVVRAQHLRQYHAVPSITLDVPIPGVIGANADIRAKKPDNSSVKLSETIYMRIRNGTAYVFDDQAGQEW